MKNEKPEFLNFTVDHMTMLVDPALYKPAYLAFRVIFGVPRSDVLYEKRREWEKGKGEVSMTYAVKVGEGSPGDAMMRKTIMAIVQPSEPPSMPSHVRSMLRKHSAGSHWQHVALRTPDLLAFHRHALERGVNFITPILKDEDEDLIQVFSGEWFVPGGSPSAVFFEFVQRDPTPELLRKLKEHNRQAWFRDKTFMGLYGEKEAEYRGGKVIPFIDDALFRRLAGLVEGKNVWEITEADVAAAERIMLEHAKPRKRPAGRPVARR